MWLSKIWAKLNTVECLHLFTKVVYIIRERRQNKEKKKKEKKKPKRLKYKGIKGLEYRQFVPCQALKRRR